MDATTTQKDRRNGQFTHSLEKVCARCGHTKGDHDAEAPFAQYDLSFGFECEGFKAKRGK